MSAAASRQLVAFGPYEFDPRLGLLYRGDEEIYIPPRAAGVLQCLLEQPGEVVQKQALLDAVWEDSYVSDTSLSEAVGVLRHALGDDPQSPTFIRTHHRRGYQFIAEVRQGPGEEESPASREARVVRDEPDAVAGRPDAAPISVPSAGAVPLPLISVGSSLGQYEILAELGAGAMGIVYRAKDTVLDREVAIKVLPEDFLSDPGRVERLEREAKLLASVSHPNIASIHSLEESDGIKFPVLELVEGETLDQRLRAGPMDVTSALEIARQIAAALEAAHERGIIHRDLKPANIKLTPDGQVKVLDFGLAKALEVHVLGADASQSPTESMTIVGSRRGSIVGTAAYMSPEQARGEEVDKRADIWSFGCVMYELLTGRRAFEGDTVSETIAGVLEREPDWEALPPETPRAARRVVRRCLNKDSRDRLHAIADARIEIDDALSGPGEGSLRRDEPSEQIFPGPRRRRAVSWGLAGVTVITAALAIWSMTRPDPPASAQFPNDLVLPPGMEIVTSPSPNLAISPDGSRIVYAARREDGSTSLFLHSANEVEPRPIPGTEDAQGPFFSPDGQSLGFFRDRDSKLYRISLAGGQPIPLADVLIFGGATWGPDDIILFTPTMNTGISKVPAYGGEVETLTELDIEDGEQWHAWPHFLPGGREFLLMVAVDGLPWQTYVCSVETGQKRRLHGGGLYARYVPTGHLAFVQNYSLMAVPFDLVSLEITGTPLVLREDVRASTGWGKADFAFSDSGTLVYVSGGEPMRMLERVDLSGTGEPLLEEPVHFATASLSEDGTHLAVGRVDAAGNIDLWALDLTRDTSLSRLTTEPGVNNFPTWTPDGEWVTFLSNRAGDNDLWQIRADRTGEARLLIDTGLNTWPSSWSPGAEKLAVFQEGRDTGLDLWIFDPKNPDELEPYLVTAFGEALPVFSPDGRWIAYQSDRDGLWEVFVAPYPLIGRAEKVSAGGGLRPHWSPTGREIYYQNGEEFLVVPLELEPELSAGQPRTLFAGTYSGLQGVFPDGQHLLMARPAESEPHEISIVYNWFNELRQRVPSER